MGTLLPDKVYQCLKRSLFAGEYSPGVRLDYRQLAAQLGVSTTPVREAMAKLASEGLVSLVPRAGAIVRALDREELVQLYGVREAVESHAATLAAGLISNLGLQRLETLWQKMEGLIPQAGPDTSAVLTGEALGEFLRCDFEFHMTLIEASGNPRLVKIAGDSAAHTWIFGTERFAHSAVLLREANAAHAAILAAVREHDPVKARELVVQHIRRSLELTLAAEDFSGRTNWWLPGALAAT